MTGERVKIVVWDSIGNTLLGVRPWSSWDAPVRETLLRENPSAESIGGTFRLAQGTTAERQSCISTSGSSRSCC